MNDTHLATTRPALAALRTDLLHRMLLLRQTDVCPSPTARAAQGTGTEAAAVGVMTVLGPADAVVSAEPRESAAGGIFDAAARFHSGATVRGTPAAAIERAETDLREHRPAVTVCLLGDDMSVRRLADDLDLAARRGLPVLFCWEDHGAGPDAHRPHDLVGTVDGMDVEAVLLTTRTTVRDVRAGAGPRLLQLRMDDVGALRDPVLILATRMRDDHQIDDNALSAIERDAVAQAGGARAGAAAVRAVRR
jgi:hypothetical protein